MLDKFAVARALREIGTLLELEGENPFKVRAYENGARAVEALADDLARARRGGGASRRCPASARRSRRRSRELHRDRDGSSSSSGCARSTRPASSSCCSVPDLGPKKIAALHAALGIGDGRRARGGLPRAGACAT